MNYACKTAMTGIALAWGEQTLPRELINYRIVMDPWSQMMACILFVLSLWGTICIRELRLNKQNLLYAVISYLFPLTVMISVIIISHKNIGFGSAAGYRSFIFILQYFCFLHQSVFSTFWKKYSFGYVRRKVIGNGRIAVTAAPSLWTIGYITAWITESAAWYQKSY